jgi:hypothetical protein
VTGWIFVARPVTRATTRDEELGMAVQRLITARGGTIREGGSAPAGWSDAEVAVANIGAVVGAAALVVILPEDSATVSSVWLELGMALGVSLPTVIVAQGCSELPFLARASAAANPHLIEVVGALDSAMATAERVLTAMDHVMGSTD